MKKLSYFILILALFSCGVSNENDTKSNPTVDSTASENADFDDLDTPVNLSDETLEEVLHSIPSPLEFSDQLKDKGAELNEKLIAIPKK
ncbi:MAG: hypothetical protein MRY83_06195, partial [Flavobacteriales bacterium]|nr:hypothetical protein [Flavobacteriales bacterium]